MSQLNLQDTKQKSSGINLLGAYSDSSSEDEDADNLATPRNAIPERSNNHGASARTVAAGGVKDTLSEFLAEIVSLEPAAGSPVVSCASPSAGTSSCIQTTLYTTPNTDNSYHTTSSTDASNSGVQEVSSEWQQCFDDTSQNVYYWNTRTNEVSWIPPQQWQNSSAAAPAAIVAADDNAGATPVAVAVAGPSTSPVPFGPQLPPVATATTSTTTGRQDADAVKASLFRNNASYSKTTVTQLKAVVRSGGSGGDLLAQLLANNDYRQGLGYQTCRHRPASYPPQPPHQPHPPPHHSLLPHPPPPLHLPLLLVQHHHHHHQPPEAR